MSANATRQPNLVTNRGRFSAHIVQFYEKDDYLVESVARFFDPIMAASGAALVVATKAHRDALADELKARGFDIETAIQQGRYVALDAAATVLAQFMVDGWPDEARCQQALVRTDRAGYELLQTSDVAVFGEMVALLWADEKREAAVRLEQIWNQLAKTHSFALFCAYPMAGFDQDKHRKLFFNICG